MNRREMMLAAGVTLAGGTVASAHCGTCGPKKKGLKFDNASFYGADGKFDVEKGKDAIIALMKYHGYPVYPGIRDALWVSDYGTGEFTKLGLAARMWVNNTKDKYMLMDLFLLPGQMLPEHWHLKPADPDLPTKIEGWVIRYGSSHVVGEGEPNLCKSIKIPKCHNGGKVTVEHEVYAKAGDFVPLNRVEAHHWQYAGPEGAIMSEVANCHDDKSVRHLDPAINKFFLGE